MADRAKLTQIVNAYCRIMVVTVVILSTQVSNLEQRMGMATMTRVQQLTIPVILRDRDVLVKSQTGSGKLHARISSQPQDRKLVCHWNTNTPCPKDLVSIQNHNQAATCYFSTVL